MGAKSTSGQRRWVAGAGRRKKGARKGRKKEEVSFGNTLELSLRGAALLVHLFIIVQGFPLLARRCLCPPLFPRRLSRQPQLLWPCTLRLRRPDPPTH
jgi:hypothetical protein